MSNKNYIKNILGLQEVIAEQIVVKSDFIEFHIRNKRKKQKCPCCGKQTARIHDYRIQTIKDLAFRKPTVLKLKKRRYICPHCNKKFYEEIPWLPRYSRRTMRLTEDMIIKLRKTVSYSHVAEECNLSATTVSRVFDVVSYPPKPLPEVLLIDEFKGNTGSKKYQCILMNGVTGEVIDILPDRDTSTLIHYFKNKNTATVRFLVSDMWKPYRDLCLTVFKNARHIADKYHVTRQVMWAMEAVRKDVQKELNKNSRLRYKHTANLLRKSRSKLKDEQEIRLSQVLSTSSELRKAYWLKEDFGEIFKAKSYPEAIERLKEWIKKAVESEIERFVKCAKTMLNWSKSIAMAAEFGYTNGRIEGMNNKIKVLKRVSFGLRNFNRFRNRILHTTA